MSIFGGIAGGLLSVLGGGLAASGSRDAANAQINAGRDALNFQNNEMGRGRLSQLALALGPDEAERIFRGTMPQADVERIFGRAATAPGFTPDQQRKLDDVNRRIAEAQSSLSSMRRNRGQANPQLAALIAERDALTQLGGGDPGKAGELDMGAFRSMGPGVLTQYAQLGEDVKRQGDQVLGDYDSATGTLRREAGGIERDARRFGKGQIERINRDSARAVENANALAQSSLLARGLGASSVLGNTLSQNAIEGERQRADAIGGVEDQQARLMTGVRQGSLGLLSQRLGARTPLVLNNQDRTTSLQSSLLNTKLGLLTGPSSNPWLGQSATPYFPGVSGSAAAQQTIGNSLGAVGGPLLGYGLSQWMGGGGQGRNIDEMRADARRYGGV